jgi:hypothetical protein
MSSRNGDNRQYDPVANAALGAVRASNRAMREVQRRTGAPQLPAQQSVNRNARNAIQTVSSFSPFNVYARGEIPTPGDVGDEVQAMVPSNIQSGVDLPNPQQVLPDGVPFYDPLGLFSGDDSGRSRRSIGGNGSNGSKNGSNESGRSTNNTEQGRRRSMEVGRT